MVAALLLLVAGSLAVLELAPGVPAQLADNLLRPVIGSSATIKIESVMLDLTDLAKQLAFHTFARPSADIYAAQTRQQPPPPPSDPHALDLSPFICTKASGLQSLPGEGEWTAVSLPQFRGRNLMARTFYRPDPDRDYAVVALIKMDIHKLRLHTVAGTWYPGGELGKPGPGVIPEAVQAGGSLVAAFNGGFQYQDGHYGMQVRSTTYVPLLPGVGTLTLYKDGRVDLAPYDPTAGPAKAPVEAMRQNGPLIVDQGKVTDAAKSGSYDVWGRTTTDSMYTWRSGIGLTSRGNLVYAAGPSLTAQTLARALKAAGAVRALQLDINAFWVRFVTFQPKLPAGYSYESLVKDMQDGGYAYLHGYNKDFFYLTTTTTPQNTKKAP